MYVDVTLGAVSTTALLGIDDSLDFVVRVHGPGSLSELRAALSGAAAGVPFGHEAAIETSWIRAQGHTEAPWVWEACIERLLGAAERRGQADVEGRWIVGPIIWQPDPDLAAAHG
jgi:hypothetical protein